MNNSVCLHGSPAEQGPGQGVVLRPGRPGFAQWWGGPSRAVVCSSGLCRDSDCGGTQQLGRLLSSSLVSGLFLFYFFGTQVASPSLTLYRFVRKSFDFVLVSKTRVTPADDAWGGGPRGRWMKQFWRSWSVRVGGLGRGAAFTLPGCAAGARWAPARQATMDFLRCDPLRASLSHISSPPPFRQVASWTWASFLKAPLHGARSPSEAWTLVCGEDS